MQVSLRHQQQCQRLVWSAHAHAMKYGRALLLLTIKIGRQAQKRVLCWLAGSWRKTSFNAVFHSNLLLDVSTTRVTLVVRYVKHIFVWPLRNNWRLLSPVSG